MLSYHLIAFIFKNPEREVTCFSSYLFLLSFFPLCSRQVICESLDLIWLVIIYFLIPADSTYMILQKNSPHPPYYVPRSTH